MPAALHAAAEGGVCQNNVIRMLSQKDEFCSSPNCYNREENEYLCKRPDFLTECSCPQRCEWVDDPDNAGIHTNLTMRMNFCQASECVGTAAESPAGKPPNWGGACTPGADGKIPAACPCPTAFVQTHSIVHASQLARYALGCWQQAWHTWFTVPVWCGSG